MTGKFLSGKKVLCLWNLEWDEWIGCEICIVNFPCFNFGYIESIMHWPWCDLGMWRHAHDFRTIYALNKMVVVRNKSMLFVSVTYMICANPYEVLFQAWYGDIWQSGSVFISWVYSIYEQAVWLVKTVSGPNYRYQSRSDLQCTRAQFLVMWYITRIVTL